MFPMRVGLKSAIVTGLANRNQLLMEGLAAYGKYDKLT